MSIFEIITTMISITSVIVTGIFGYLVHLSSKTAIKISKDSLNEQKLATLIALNSSSENVFREFKDKKIITNYNKLKKEVDSAELGTKFKSANQKQKLEQEKEWQKENNDK